MRVRRGCYSRGVPFSLDNVSMLHELSSRRETSVLSYLFHEFRGWYTSSFREDEKLEINLIKIGANNNIIVINRPSSRLFRYRGAVLINWL